MSALPCRFVSFHGNLSFNNQCETNKGTRWQSTGISLLILEQIVNRHRSSFSLVPLTLYKIAGISKWLATPSTIWFRLYCWQWRLHIRKEQICLEICRLESMQCYVWKRLLIVAMSYSIYIMNNIIVIFICFYMIRQFCQ